MTRALRVRMLVAVALLAAAVACVIEATDGLQRLELSTVDARFKLRGEQPAPSNLIVVGIDDKTFDELDERWPFSRNRFAKVLETVSAAEPSVIVYDVQFTEESDDPRADNRLIEASRAAGNVVFSTTEVAEDGSTRVFGGGEGLEYAQATAAASSATATSMRTRSVRVMLRRPARARTARRGGSTGPRRASACRAPARCA